MSLRALAKKVLEQPTQGPIPHRPALVPPFQPYTGGTLEQKEKDDKNQCVPCSKGLEQKTHNWNKADFEERAGILQANGIPQEWAEGFAALYTMRRPIVFFKDRWEQLLNDAGLFLDRWGRQAAGLGWTTLDLFGFHFGDREELRFDGMGLCILLRSRSVIALTADTARIDCGGGAFQTYYRRKPAESIALWDLETHGKPSFLTRDSLKEKAYPTTSAVRKMNPDSILRH